MMCWTYRMILTYMVITIMHVPFPVFDGDNLRSGETASTVALSASDLFDVDFILLGCDPPDDSDDGPVDDDPENGSTSLFGPSFSCPRSIVQSIYPFAWRQPELDRRGSAPTGQASITDHRVEFELQEFSFGKLCQSGTAHLRC